MIGFNFFFSLNQQPRHQLSSPLITVTHSNRIYLSVNIRETKYLVIITVMLVGTCCVQIGTCRSNNAKTTELEQLIIAGKPLFESIEGTNEMQILKIYTTLIMRNLLL